MYFNGKTELCKLVRFSLSGLQIMKQCLFRQLQYEVYLDCLWLSNLLHDSSNKYVENTFNARAGIFPHDYYQELWKVANCTIPCEIWAWGRILL